MIETHYMNLSIEQKLQLSHVCTNATYRHLLNAEIKEARHELENLSPGGDVTQFMLDYAMAQIKLQMLEASVEFLDYMLRDITKITGETEL